MSTEEGEGGRERLCSVLWGQRLFNSISQFFAGRKSTSSMVVLDCEWWKDPRNHGRAPFSPVGKFAKVFDGFAFAR